MFFFAAIALFSIFLANVLAGAFGASGFLGDAGEMLMLFAASLAFAVATLKREAESRKKATERPRTKKPTS